MKYRKIDKIDAELSMVGLGTWVFGSDMWGGSKGRECSWCLDMALEMGVNLIDTAPVYGHGTAESIIGRCLKGRRNKVFLSTKCGLIRRGGKIRHDLSPASIRNEIETSLRRLQTDYIDIYFCHWPDPGTAIEETLEAMVRLKEEGKIRYIGISNFKAALFEKACNFTEILFTQNQYSILERSVESDILPVSKQHQVNMICYGPLAGGILTGKYTSIPDFPKKDARNLFYKYYSGENFSKTQTILEKFRSIGRPFSQVAINWLRQKEEVSSVIVGCRNLQQLKENLGALSWELSAEEIQMIDQLILS